MTGKVNSVEQAGNARQSGKMVPQWKLFKVMLKSHHVDEQIIESLCAEPTSVLPQAKHHTPLTAKESGYLESN